MTVEARHTAIIDASLALAWILPGEAEDVAMTLRARAADPPGTHLLAPVTFWYEVAHSTVLNKARAAAANARTAAQRSRRRCLANLFAHSSSALSWSAPGARNWPSASNAGFVAQGNGVGTWARTNAETSAESSFIDFTSRGSSSTIADAMAQSAPAMFNHVRNA